MDNVSQFSISPLSLQSICPSMPIARAGAISSLFNAVLPVYGMLSKDICEEFLATLAHESMEFSAKSENLNYSAEAILKTWPSRFHNLLEASIYAHNPQKLANKVYNGRMGNVLGSNDGWNFRGAGFIQNTGRDSIVPYYNFKKAGKGFPVSETIISVEQVADLIRTNDVWALDAACWEFAVSKGLIDEAINDDFLKITKAINGGELGMADREMYLSRCKQYL